MRSLPLILSSAFLILSSPIAYTQTLNDCSNLGLELGTFQGWKAGYGTWSVDPSTNAVVIESQANGFQPEQHRIRHKSEGRVPEITADVIPFVPPGSDYAVQLGNAVNGAQFEHLTTSFQVDADYTLFQYQFAVIFEDPDHLPVQQPRFELRVTDQQGNTLPCGYYQVTAAGAVDGFKSQGKIRYRDWTTAGVDLRNYVGQVVTVRISTFDYPFDESLVASEPASPRDSARLLVVRPDGTLEHKRVSDLATLLPSPALLVANDTRVLAARLLGSKDGSGGKVEA